MKIVSVLFDLVGKITTEIMSHLLTCTADFINERAVHKLIRKGAKAKSNEIMEAINSYNIETD